MRRAAKRRSAPPAKAVPRGPVAVPGKGKDHVGTAILPTDPALAAKAAVLIEALPYLRRFRGATVVIKYGGAAMSEPALRDSFAEDVTLLEHVGLHPVVVHGGGPELTDTLRRLGIESQFVDGHRVTDAETADIAQMVLCGRVNKELVARLVRAGARAVGLSGTDAGLLRVRRLAPEGRDIGFVGTPESVDHAVLQALLERGFLPVVAPTADGPGGQVYNVNADLVAAAVAAALRAEKLVYLSDVPGLVLGGAIAERIAPADVRRALASGEATGGMRPKLEAALDAIATGVKRVHLVDGRVAHALLLEVFTRKGVGTLIQAAEEERA